MQEPEILCQSEANLDIDQQPSTASKIRTALHRHSPIVKEETGPAYVISDDYSSTNAVLVTGENVHVLTTGFPWMRDYILAGNDIGPVTASAVNQSAKDFRLFSNS